MVAEDNVHTILESCRVSVGSLEVLLRPSIEVMLRMHVGVILIENNLPDKSHGGPEIKLSPTPRLPLKGIVDFK